MEQLVAIENDDQMIVVTFMLLFGLILDYFHGLYWPFLAFCLFLHCNLSPANTNTHFQSTQTDVFLLS